MNKHIKFPINIAQAQGGYALELKVGSEQQAVKLLIDTGSSTLAFKASGYVPEDDQCIELTQYAQCVTYGKGGWAGPVINSEITYANESDSLVLESAPFALVSDQQANSFLGLDGIIGLAYHHLNKAYDLSSYYETSGNKDKKTYPWSFSDEINQSGIPTFKNFLRKYPEKDITPIFTAFEEKNITPNKFALLTHRSIAYVPDNNMTLEQKANQPNNKGLFILGDIEIDSSMFSGESKDIKVLHDAYYNTNLLSVEVEGYDSISVPKLDNAHLDTFFTNSIIDSGSSYLMLQKQIYQYVMDSFKKINPKLMTHVNAFNQAQLKQQAYVPKDLNLKDWPNLYFTFEGVNGEEVKLCCQPNHYWQLNAISPNRSFFTLLNQIEKWPNQSIIGLPIISSYLCIFDRSQGNNGVIKFANKI